MATSACQTPTATHPSSGGARTDQQKALCCPSIPYKVPTEFMDKVFRRSPAGLPLIAALVALVLSQTTTPSAKAQAESPKPSPSTATSPAPTAKEDLITVAKSAGNFTTFLKIVDAAGLTATLSQPGTYTIFAPTDTAFSKLPTGKLEELLKAENKAKLVALVSYHVAATKLTAADLSKTDEVKTLEGTEIDVDVTPDGKVIEVDDAKILGSDLEASNGVLHSIDAVLQP